MNDLNPARLIGRGFSILGYLWVGFAIFGGIGLLRDLGFSGDLFGGVLGSVIPGFILIGLGRSISKRAGSVEAEQQIPQPSPARTRTAPAPRPAQSGPRPQSPRPKPSPTPVRQPDSRPAELRHMDKSLEELLGEMETGEVTAGKVPAIEDLVGDTDLDFRPMTSEEMIADARRKWGSNRPGSSGS